MPALSRILAGWVLWTALACEPVHAQAAESPEYYALIEQALAEYDARNFAEARAMFLKAHAVYPNARTLRGVGMMEFELRNYPDSITRLEDALASNVNPIEGELRTATRELLERARSFVAPVILNIDPVPAELRVHIDGALTAWVAERAYNLTVGEHALEISAPGFVSVRRAISVKGGAAVQISVLLRAAALSPSSAPVSATQPMPGREATSSILTSPWLWLGVGTVLAGGILGTAVLIRDKHGSPGLERGDVGVDGLVMTLRGGR